MKFLSFGVSGGAMLAAGLACAGTKLSAEPGVVTASPSPEPADQIRKGRKGKAGKGGGRESDEACTADSAEFKTSEGPFGGINLAMRTLDTMNHAEGANYDLQAKSVPCSVDLTPMSFGDPIDYVGWTVDGRGLVVSDGTGAVRSIEVLDVDSGKVWRSSTVNEPRVDGSGVLVEQLGQRVTGNDWPAGCDPKLKGQMSCTGWSEMRWEAGDARPTGKVGGVITE